MSILAKKYIGGGILAGLALLLVLGTMMVSAATATIDVTVFPDPVNPPVSDNDGEWILFENNSGIDVDMSNWQITDEAAFSYTFPGSFVLADGDSYRICSNNDSSQNGGLSDCAVDWGAGNKLNNKEESLTLYDDTSTEVAVFSWDTELDGEERLFDFSIEVADPTPEPSSITIVKVTDPAESEQVFYFNGDLGEFSLDTNDGDNTYEDTFSMGKLDADTYDVTEVLPNDSWTLTEVTCGDASIDELTDGVTIHLGEGEDVTCTFMNTYEEDTMSTSTMSTSTPPTGELDFGDAPNGAGLSTSLAENGARHIIVPGFYLGESVDAEVDRDTTGTSDALNDDNDGVDDEDGVFFLGAGGAECTHGCGLAAGAENTIRVVASESGYLDAWVDMAGGDDFDAADQIFASQPLDAGDNYLTFMLPVDAQIQGETFARFRFSSAGGLSPFGLADDGEVEDYQVHVRALCQSDEDAQFSETFKGCVGAFLDYGDAPDPGYKTSIDYDGARHFVSDLYLGNRVDSEVGSFNPGSDALYDDANSILGGAPYEYDDEDGVHFVLADEHGGYCNHGGTAVLDSCNLSAGSTTTVEVVASQDGYLDGWIDFNGGGTFDGADQIFFSEPVVTGTNTLAFLVPSTANEANHGETFARFRLSSTGDLDSYGLALDGEVEDYQIGIIPAESDVCLVRGHKYDMEGNGLANWTLGVAYEVSSTSTATTSEEIIEYQNLVSNLVNQIESLDSEEDNEQISLLISQLNQLLQALAQISEGVTTNWNIVNTAITNEDGYYCVEETDEYTKEDLAEGEGYVAFEELQDGWNIYRVFLNNIPETDFRYGSDPVDVYTFINPTSDELVVDFYNQPVVSKYDYGDAPDSYNTLFSNNGPRHLIVDTLYLGQTVDGESDGQPSVDALGDDLLDSDDEDGVVFGTSLIPDATSTVTVTVVGEGFLNGWIDFNADGDWADSGEHVLLNEAVSTGTSTFSFVVPSDAATDVVTYARFRLSSVSGLLQSDTLLKPSANVEPIDGEVEDYAVLLESAGTSTSTTTPTVTTTSGGGGDGGTSSRVSGGTTGFVLGASTSTQGEVLGESCSTYLNEYIIPGFQNNPEQVMRLQEFLNEEMGSSLAVNGVYDAATIEVVKAFQLKYKDDILTPWGLTEPTGIVYLTTQRKINLIKCSALTLPVPQLVPLTL